MRPWPRNPVLYEINTWVWLGELGRRLGRPVDLGSVPAAEWDVLAARGFDAVWLMGVWERSPAGIAISLGNPGLRADFQRALPDFSPEDDVGSPYCVRRYAVDGRLGGAEGLAAARRELAGRGVRLLLDFVPNHVAPDHPWVATHPGHFVRGTAEDLARDPSSFVEAGGTVFALGRDPFFPAWPDVLQLDAFQPALRQAVIETLSEIAGQCDGVRCDMAMLVLNQVFERTWGGRVGPRPVEDYWAHVIPAVRARHPDLRFIAEAYWDLEWALQQQGFDHCYDKKLYDRMEHGDAESIRLHLLAHRAYQQGMVRFIENHDEPRAAAVFPPGKARAAAVAALTLTGAKLVHEGQLEGRKVKLPVFLGRRPTEAVDGDLVDFYQGLLTHVTGDAFKDGSWALCETRGWPDNQTCRNLLAWCWAAGGERWLVVVNFSPARSQARVQVPWGDLEARNWKLTDVLAGASYDRSGDEMRGEGLHVELGPWQCHLLRVGTP